MVNRIRELLETRQLSPTQFADLIGVGRPVISHILSERNKPSLEVVQKILDAFPDVSLSWLMKGIGSMLADATPASAAAPAISAPVAPSSSIPSAPFEAVTPPSAGSPVQSAPVASIPAQPQAFMPTSASVAQLASVASPPPRPLPPKFRPTSALVSPPIDVATPSAAAVGPVATASTAAPQLVPSANPAPIAPPASAAAFVAAPSPTPQPVVAPHAKFEPTGLAQGSQQAAAAPALFEADRMVGHELAPASAAGPSAKASAPPVAEVAAATPNPAAALSFLGEPGKAIRRIVIFYRDGSFSDYVPEGH